jgi:cold shock CspA family protein/ribosome-associated translation inhibitor RaiA
VRFAISTENAETPLQVVFHNTKPSAALEAEIKKRVAKLERLYGRLTSCRVSIEALHRQHRTGNVFEVHIEIFAPGRTIVVSHEPHHNSERHRKPTIRSAIHDAFKTAEERLKSFKAQRGEPSKPEDTLLQGRIDELHPDQDYGYIATSKGSQLYFHRNSLIGGGFDQLRPGDVVEFVEAMGDTGPTASKVWPARP